MKRRGFTIIELIVTMTVMAILGTALIRMMVADSKFVSHIEGLMSARQGARAAMTVMTAELQGVANGGVTAATTTSITIRMPVAFGMTCNTQGQWTHLSVLPTDSAMLASASVTGLAWRDSSGTYNDVTGITFSMSGGSLGQCTADSVRVVSGGQVARARDAGGVASGVVFYVFEDITYSFESSGLVPGRTGLFRTDGSSTKEELLAPFDSTASFGFLVSQNLTPLDTVPSDLSTIRGLQLNLVGESYNNPQSRSEPAEFKLVTTIAFKNYVD